MTGCLHSFEITELKEELESVLAHFDPGTRTYEHVQRLIGICDRRLTSKAAKESRGGRPFESWEVTTVEDKVRVLLRDHPEVGPFLRKPRRPAPPAEI